METIFDHNVTSEEKDIIIGRTFSKEEYLAWTNQEYAYQNIASLYFLRENIQKAEEYAEKLPPMMRLDFLRTIYHP